MADDDGRSFDILRSATILSFPIVALFAGSHLLNANRLPGEGFSAGLLVAFSFLTLYVGVGYQVVEAELPVWVKWAMPAGFGVALGSALLGLAMGKGLLGHEKAIFVLWGEQVLLSTSTLFDIAIFLVVLGGVHAIFRALPIGGRG